jgi:hypothetical protein
MPTICNYINPFSNKFHALDDFKRLSCLQKVGIVMVTTVLACSIIFSILAIPIFRYLVGRCIDQLPLSETDKKVQELTSITTNCMQNVMSDYTNKKITNCKHLAVCKTDQEQEVFEVDTPKYSESEIVEKIKRWLVHQCKCQKLEHISIEGRTFCLEKDTVYGGSWAVSQEIVSGRLQRFGIQTSTFRPIQDSLRMRLERQLKGLGLSLNASITTPADFFKCKFVQPAL